MGSNLDRYNMAAPTVKPVIAVPFYSMYGHVATLAEEVIAGVEAAGGIAKPYFIQETLPAEVLTKMYAGTSLTPKYPLLEPQHLTEVDGFIFGIPTRYGRAPAQVSAFFDKTGGLWASQALNGKYAATFTSTAGQHGGQELTHLTTLPFFVHHGCIYVPIGYKEPYISDVIEVHGASPWGTSTVSDGDGSRVPTEGEKRVARFQGEHFTKIVAQAVRGRHLLEADAAGTSAAGTAATGTAADGTAAVQSSQTAAAQPTEAGAASSAAATGGAAVAGAARNDEPAVRAAPLETDKAATAPAAPAAPAAADAKVPATDAAPAAQSAPASAPAPAAASQEAAPSTTRATAPVPEKKKGGLFSCCSANAID
ncbi:hypothetical protein CspeluHIS016_0107430 [Cutaneotrichosporon spelunceum]|uniref:Flavodoxin-like domain-containing protein n=1 Tax=Cutaneotrichosporon spelunceum TaxID=1672016 RepID=A0AAD3Y9T5_9TREE|nr:hypothetical protein CspeluHIS016_0107430 [Cutaneotrichosporon spelunceum]